VADRLLTGSPLPILLLRSVGAVTEKLARREARMDQAQPPRADEQVTGVANVTYDALALLTSALEGRQPWKRISRIPRRPLTTKPWRYSSSSSTK
jgi:hypothetical protein